MKTKNSEKDIIEWCKNALELGYTEKKVEESVKGCRRRLRKEVLKIFNILKGGNFEMPKKKKIVVEEEEFEEEEFDDEVPEELEEEEEEVVPKVKRKVRDTNWQIQRIPETWRILDPITKEVVAEALSVEEVKLQLAVISAQYSSESARNTR